MKRKRDSKKPAKKQHVEKPGTVTWMSGDEEGYGFEWNYVDSQTRVAKPKIAIRDAILYHCQSLVQTPKKWFEGDLLKYKEYTPFGSLRRANPAFSRRDLEKIKEEITNTVPKELEKVCGSDLKDPKISDFVFLATLGKKRNWRQDCCICLSNNMMGTTCGCGHFEIAIFRPCGHSVCVNPCFEKMMKHQGSKMETRKFTTKGGEVFLLPGQKAVTSMKNFLCPLCRQNVESVFRAEDTGFRGKHPKFNLSQLTERCWDSTQNSHAFSASSKE